MPRPRSPLARRRAAVLPVLLAAACGAAAGGAGPAAGPPAATGPAACDPSADIAAYPRFATTPEVVQHLYPNGGGRDYPVIDVHTHLLTTAAEEQELQRRVGIHAVVEATAIPDYPNFVQVWDPASTAALRAAYPPPNLVQFYPGVYLAGFSEDRLPAILAKFDEHRAAGARGVKLFKNFGLTIDDASGARLRIDDRRLYPLWRKAAELGWTVSIHVADPDSWLQQKFWDSPYTKQDLVQQFVRVVADNPGTTFVAIHMMNLVDSDAEIDQLGTYLERYPNLYADVAARSQYLVSRDRDHLRAFFVAHQDKLMFATDRAGEGVASYEEELRFWETGDTSRTFYLASSGKGLALPPDVLRKFYYENALRAFCGAFR